MQDWDGQRKWRCPFFCRIRLASNYSVNKNSRKTESSLCPPAIFLFPSKRIFTIRYLPDPLTVHSKTNFLICFYDLQILSSTESPVS